MNFEKIRVVLGNFSVGIAGCGGLGSNAAVSLARVGIGKLILADFDKIEASNLNRQYYFLDQVGEFKVSALKQNITRISQDVIVEEHIAKLDPKAIQSLFSGCDIIIEAFDKAEMKEMIIETVQTQFPDKPIISGVGMAGWGHNDTLSTQQFGNLYIVGDNSSEASDTLPPIAPRVCAVANMMANVVLEILLGKDN